MIGLVVTVVLFPLIGWSLGRRGFGEAFLLGLGVTGSVLFIAGVLHVPLAIAFWPIGMWGVVRGVRELKRGIPGPRIHSPVATTLMILPLVPKESLNRLTTLFSGSARNCPRPRPAEQSAVSSSS